MINKKLFPDLDDLRFLHKIMSLMKLKNFEILKVFVSIGIFKFHIKRAQKLKNGYSRKNLAYARSVA